VVATETVAKRPRLDADAWVQWFRSRGDVPRYVDLEVMTRGDAAAVRVFRGLVRRGVVEGVDVDGNGNGLWKLVGRLSPILSCSGAEER
jgi:hypothetical protein